MKKSKTQTKKTNKLLLVPLGLLLSVVPLLVHMHVYNTNLSQFAWYSSEDKAVDFFLYYKAIAIIAIAVVMCVILAYRYWTDKRSFRFIYEFIPLLVYAVFTILSSVFSEYKWFCFHGMYDMFESLWVLLGYCVICFYAYQMVRTIDDVDYLMKWLTVGLCIMLVIGLTQAFGHDFFATTFGKKLITDHSYWGNLDTVELTFRKGKTYLTLYNPNYVTSYFALILPIEIALFIRNKRIGYRILYALMLAASLVCFLASGNRSMIVIFVAVGILAVILLHKQLLQAWKIVVPLFVVFVVFVSVFLSKNSSIIQKFIYHNQNPNVVERVIAEIRTEDDCVAIIYNDNELKISYDVVDDSSVAITMCDAQGTLLANTYDETAMTYQITDERFAGITVQPIQFEANGSIGIQVVADGINWIFSKGDDQTYYYYNVFGKLDKIQNMRVTDNLLVKLFDDRGVIWTKSLTQIKHSLLFGTGADTYALYYPQNDYVSKAYLHTDSNVDVKPHNAYLQIQTQSGGIALLAILVFFCWYLVQGFRLYGKTMYDNGLKMLGVTLVIANSSYMLQMVLNDSTVSVSPIFWTFLGIGFAVNHAVGMKSDKN